VRSAAHAAAASARASSSCRADSEPAGNVFFDDIATTEQFFDFLQVVMLPTIFTQVTTRRACARASGR
jgi:hypothetical protein